MMWLSGGRISGGLSVWSIGTVWADLWLTILVVVGLGCWSESPLKNGLISGSIVGLIVGLIGGLSRAADRRADLRADLRADRRADQRLGSRLTESYYFSGDFKLEVESVLEEDDSRLDLWADLRLDLWADRRADRRAS